jgi:hypothetical protein
VDGSDSYYSTVPGKSVATARNPILDNALSMIRIEPKPVPGKNKPPEAETSYKLTLEERQPKPCAGKRCPPPHPPSPPERSPKRRDWTLSQDVYRRIENNCGGLENEIAQLEVQVASLRERNQALCSAIPPDSGCAALTKKLADAEAKLAHTRETFERCVLVKLRQSTKVTVLGP